ncbi:SDR family NAD(P)-dependent oxidoreductase, partial [Actinosynnema sp.]|uniref:beta-ketoacyl reductase n=1 Tax=Actinosynnema sp. TaxID=1872144 RepID=UPI003F82E2ED
MSALGHRHGDGAHVDWDAVFAGQHPRPVELPTYPFQRHHPTPWTETEQPLPPVEALPAAEPLPVAAPLPVEPLPAAPLPAEPSLAGESLPATESSPAVEPSPASEPSPAVEPSPATGEPPRPPGDLLRLPGDLLRLEWRPVALAAPVTDPVVWSPRTTATTTEDAVRDLTAQALGRVRDWVADPERADTRLVVLTSGAVGPGAADLAGAALWGLLRAAQSEHPGRFVLVDADDPDLTAVSAAVATGEPQLLLRDGRAHAARLTRVPATAAAPRWRGTVLVTGGTGAVGRALAAHLARSGAEHLVLASHTGPNHPDTTALVAELTAEGAAVTVVACDVTDRPAVAALLAQLPDEQPLTAVVHAAAVPGGSATTRSATTRSAEPTTPDPAVAGTLLLHELTRHLDLEAFVLCSSASGTVGGIGRVDQAVAGAFLDAFAARRADAGDPVVSLAWGPWDAPTGNLLPLAESDATALLDAALTAADPVLLPTRLAPLDHTAPPPRRALPPQTPPAPPAAP